MRVNLMHPVDELSGRTAEKVALVFRKVRGIQSARSLGSMQKSNSVQQIKSRNAISVVSKHWTTLSPEEKYEWDIRAADMPKLTQFGMLNRTTRSVYMEANYFRALDGASILHTPGDLPPIVVASKLTALSVNPATKVISYTVTLENPRNERFIVLPRCSPCYEHAGRRPQKWEFRIWNADATDLPTQIVNYTKSVSGTIDNPPYDWKVGYYGHLEFLILTTQYWPGNRSVCEMEIS